MRGILGIDEAGRGAVLGPLVVAGVLVEHEGQLSGLGVADSKAVPRRKRGAILRELARRAAVKAVVIPPEAVDGEGLTELELRAMARLILLFGPRRVFIDAPVGPRAVKGFERGLRGRLGGVAPELAIRPKADRDIPVVGAASIAAKVIRDAYIRFLRGAYGDFGWGYPGEGKTRAFLLRWWRERGELPPICRKRWATARALTSSPHRSRA